MSCPSTARRAGLGVPSMQASPESEPSTVCRGEPHICAAGTQHCDTGFLTAWDCVAEEPGLPCRIEKPCVGGCLWVSVCRCGGCAWVYAWGVYVCRTMHVCVGVGVCMWVCLWGGMHVCVWAGVCLQWALHSTVICGETQGRPDGVQGARQAS